MKIIVTGLECSGTKWMSALLKRHPAVTEVVHTSLPENPGNDTRYPDLSGADAVVCLTRYEPFRLKSAVEAGYQTGRHMEFIPPELYVKAGELISVAANVHFASYEALVGPLGYLCFQDLLRRLKLPDADFPRALFNPIDGNAKYL